MAARGIDEDTLKKIASMTRAKNYRADNSERFSIYAEIDKLEKAEGTSEVSPSFGSCFVVHLARTGVILVDGSWPTPWLGGCHDPNA